MAESRSERAVEAPCMALPPTRVTFVFVWLALFGELLAGAGDVVRDDLGVIAGEGWSEADVDIEGTPALVVGGSGEISGVEASESADARLLALTFDGFDEPAM